MKRKAIHWGMTITILCMTMVTLVGCLATDNKEQENTNANPNSTDLSAMNLEVLDFTFTNQAEEEFGLGNVKGEVWLANFIFTSCTSVCPSMTAKMAQIQQELQKEGLAVPIVSFSVDPQVDTPEALKAYGEKYKADFSQWNFLTGYEQTEIKKLAETSFKTTIVDDPESDQVLHGTSLYLVNQDGKVIKKYDGLNPPKELIVEDIKHIKK